MESFAAKDEIICEEFDKIKTCPISMESNLQADQIHKKSTCELQVLFSLMEAPPRFELGIMVLQTNALPLGYSAKKIGADYEARTRYLHLGKVALYQMS